MAKYVEEMSFAERKLNVPLEKKNGLAKQVKKYYFRDHILFCDLFTNQETDSQRKSED